MILPAFVGLFLFAPPSAHAQSRVGAVDAVVAAPGAMSGSSLSAAPSAIPALLAAPALSPLPALSAAAAPLAMPAGPSALLPAPAVTVAPAAPRPVSAPAAVRTAVPAQNNRALPENLRQVARLLDEVGPGGTSALSDDQLVALTQRMAGEGRTADFSADYLRPGRPFNFGSAETFRYRVALQAFRSGHADGPEGVKTLLDSAQDLATSAGIDVEPIIRPSPQGDPHAGLRVLPRRDGSLLNRLAFDLDRRYQAALEYVPERLAGAVAAYNSGTKVLFMPHFGRNDAYEAILHETSHAEFTNRLAHGDLSPFHGQLVAYDGRAIAPGASSYVAHMSLEEIFTHGKGVKQQLAAARRAGGLPIETVLPMLTFLYQYADVLRSARLNLALARSYVKNGKAQVRLAENEPAPFPGGRWYVVSLPYGRFYFPAREEAAPKRSLLKRVFGPTPDTAAETALIRRADVLLKAVAEIDGILVEIEAGLKADTPDLRALNASADRIAAALQNAEKSFAAPFAR